MVDLSKNWPDPTVKKTARTLGPIHIDKDGNRITAAKGSIPVDQNGEIKS